MNAIKFNSWEAALVAFEMHVFFLLGDPSIFLFISFNIFLYHVFYFLQAKEIRPIKETLILGDQKTEVSIKKNTHTQPYNKTEKKLRFTGTKGKARSKQTGDFVFSD